MTEAAGGQPSVVDVAMTFVVRLVVDDQWSADGAAEQLRAQVSEDFVLHRVRARVTRALAEEASDFGERALLTLDGALALAPTPVADDPSIVTADVAVKKLFALGLALTTVLDTVDGPARAEIEEAIDVVEELVHDVRTATFARLMADDASLRISTAADALLRAAEQLNEFANHAEQIGSAGLVEAAHSAYRALVALDESTTSPQQEVS